MSPHHRSPDSPRARRKAGTLVIALASLALLAAHVPDADAHGRGGRGGWHRGGWHRGARVGVYIGPPIVGGFYGYYGAPRLYAYPYPYVAVPPVVVWEAPPVYVQQAPAAVDGTVPAAPAAEYWYWCASPQGYYPAVDQCPGGWTPVPPR